jgi:hypothetical protein
VASSHVAEPRSARLRSVSAALAETSAEKTAAAARLFVQESRADLADATSGEALSEVGEENARRAYRAAVGRAEGR